MEPATNNRFKQESIRDHDAESRIFIRRACIAFLVVLVLFGVLVGNLYHLQVTRYEKYQTRSNHNRIKLLPVSPIRGIIYDRNGKELAINRTIYQLEVIPDRIKDLDNVLLQLKQVVDLSDEEIDAFDKERRKTRAFTPVLLKENLTEEQIARFSLRQYQFSDFEIKGYQRRYYPYGASAVHALGYVSKINDKDVIRLSEEGRLSAYAATKDIGKQGVEKYYEPLLHGKPGSEQVEVNSRGRVIRQLNEIPPVAGQDVYLTLDIELQQYIETLLDGRRGAIVVSDPRDGSILALVSSPAYDPNLFVNGISSADYALLRDDPNRPLYNRTTQGTYPPASTVKPFVGAAALTEGVITPTSAISDPGYWRLPTNKNRGQCTTADLNHGCYRDWNRWGRRGTVNVMQAIEFSSDTFFYQTAYDLGIDRLSYWMKRFGFGEFSGLDIYEESQALMPTREWKQKRHKTAWYQGDTISVGIGQGYWISTPIQINKALTTLINNGKVKTPHLLLYSQSANKIHRYQQPKDTQDLTEVSEESWQTVKKGMYNVMHGSMGSARRSFADATYKAAGKSGTAQVFGLNKGNYNAAELPEYLHDHAIFIGYAPFDKPEVAVSVVIENGGGGGKTAGPIVRKIMDYVLTSENKPTAPQEHIDLTQ